MGLIDLASSNSVWRGYDYYREKKVKSFEKISDHEITGIVAGSNGGPYEVAIDTEHPRRSVCNCPHANGRRVICKHMVALYFAVYPQEAQRLLEEAEAYEAEEEKRQEMLEQAVIKYIWNMKKTDLQQKLLELLFEGPEWQYDRFVRENIEEYWDWHT